MAGRRTEKTTKKQSVRKEEKKESRNGLLDYFRFSESYTSLILGIVVVIIAAVLLIAFIRGKGIGTTPPPAPEISSTQTGPSAPKAGETYKVQAGEDLWKIAEKAYGDGYKWVDIAKANNITDANTIVAGMELKLPEKPAEAASPAPTAMEAPTAQPVATSTPAETQSQPTQQPEKITGETYTVVSGDSLWNIALKRYNNGYRWVDIARANSLVNPDIIHRGNKLQLPK